MRGALIALALGAVAGPGGATAAELDCERLPCAAVLPGATRFEAPADDGPYRVGHSGDGTRVGWVALSTDVVDILGYSGKPLVTLVGVTPQGTLGGVRVVHHSEPILLVGIPESALHRFVESYAGQPLTARGSPDIISGATVTVLAEHRTILDTARALGIAVGVLEATAMSRGHFIDEETPWTFAEMVARKAFGRLTVTAEEMGAPPDDELFIDLYFIMADAPQIGRALLGDREYAWHRERLKPGEHLLVVLGRGSSSFKGSGFVRGGVFDRVRVEQGLVTLMFTDREYSNLSRVAAPDAPRFKEGALFRTEAGKLDPGAPFDLVFLGSRYNRRGGFSRDFHVARARYRLPDRIYVLDDPDADRSIWRGAWRIARYKVVVLGVFLVGLLGVFAGRRWSTARMARLSRLHITAMILAFVVLGLGIRAQPSITQLLTLVGSALGDWRWDLFLSEPLTFVFWIFIAVVTLVWGRGVFCGWACPYGAMNELIFKLGRRLRLPAFELPERFHRPARWLRYLVLVGLVAAFLASPVLGERLAEVEPFKSTFFVRPWARPLGLLLYWTLLLLVSLVWYRPFCRYLCPLGAALAIPGSLRLSGPYRRDFCRHCKICTRGCEPRAIREDGTIDPRECLSCMACEANYRDVEVCPPLVQITRREKKKGAGALPLALLALCLAPPARSATLRAGEHAPTLVATLALARDGDVVIVPPGTWKGPITVNTRVVLRGEEGGVIDGGGEGTVVRVVAERAVLENVTVRNSGSDLSQADACIRLEPTAERAEISGSTVEGCLFGIWVHQTIGARIVGNRVIGSLKGHRSNRGNGIHLFDGLRLLVAYNEITGGRDGIYVSATEGSQISGNQIRQTRYAVHYMFSYHTSVRSNVARNNANGFALMQSHHIEARGNVAEDNEGRGLLFRDAYDCSIIGNRLARNGEGLFFFSSTENDVIGNEVRDNEIGARVWAGSVRNLVRDNTFVGNRTQIFYVGSEDLAWGESGRGNYWADYFGWDQDGDGVGDRPYRVDSFGTRLTHRYPAAALLLRSPALELLTHLEQRMPVLQVPTVVDRAPLMRPPR